MRILKFFNLNKSNILFLYKNPFYISKMANSMYEYARQYESATENYLVIDSFIVVRIDGNGFHRFSKIHNLLKPNDKRCLDLMVESACHVMKTFYPDIIIAYGESDEFSFVIPRSSNIYNRRQNKITSLIVSSFTSSFVFNWSKFFGKRISGDTIESFPTELLYPPSFDGRCVIYPTKKSLIDYLKWRQVDCHINNLYNTTFYALTGQYTKYNLINKETNEYSTSKLVNKVGPMTPQDATKRLDGTNSSDKNEILFRDYGINYNNELEQFKKGTVLYLNSFPKKPSKVQKKLKYLSLDEEKQSKEEIKIFIENTNIIDDKFWDEHKELLER